MRKTLTILAATTALVTAIGLPAWSAMNDTAEGPARPRVAALEDGVQALPLVLVSKKDHDDHHKSGRRRHHHHHGYDDDDDGHHKSGRRHHHHHDHDDDDDDDGSRRRGVRNSAPAGSTMPPQNGLFGNGAPPKVQMN